MIKQQNTFNEGLNMDISDYLLRNTMMRNCMNMRLLDLDGTSYAITTIRGTEQKFLLSTGYIPIASREYNDILYIFSGKLDLTGTYFERFELGSFHSPNYPTGGSEVEAYAPFQNLDDAAFNVTDDIWNIKAGQFVDMSIQPEYDGSVNIIITAEDNPPRIINSGFNKDFEITERRSGANTNEYTSTSVNTETKLVLRSQKVMSIAYGAVENGGKLLGGNYTYIFRYATADFNETDVVNQSGLCSVFEGYEENKYAASVGDETTKRVRLTLSNVDTDFAYVKVYFQYSTGENSVDKRVYEIIQPVAINNKENFDFVHDGYEETQEISDEAINLDFTAFDSVTSNTQAQGYLLVGGVKQRDIDYEEFATASQNITLTTKMEYFGGVRPYNDAQYIYNKMSHFSAETYPFGIVYILEDGSLTPAFPVQGYDRVNWANLTTQQQDDIKAKGLYRFEDIETRPFYTTLLGTGVKGVTFDLSTIPQSIKSKSLGFFIVRAERKRDLISQGVIIPTLKVPSFDLTRAAQIDDIGDNGNYYDNFDQESDYKAYPIIDSIVEPWVRFDAGAGDDKYVITTDGTNRISSGYMPSPVKNFIIPGYANATDNYVRNKLKWAYFSADYILNESRYITALQRSNLGFTQLQRLRLAVQNNGIISDKWKADDPDYNVDTSLLYKFLQYIDLSSGGVYSDSIERISFVPPATFATGSDFISAISSRFKKNANLRFQVRSFTDGFFGIKFPALQDIEGISDPWQQPYNVLVDGSYDQIEGPMFNNIGRSANLGYLISIYPRTSGKPIDDINQLYDSIDGLSYYQVSDRIAWENAPSSLDVFGGDCYIGEIYKRLNYSGYTDPKQPSDVLTPAGGAPAAYGDDLSADNINQGLVFSFLQESEYNPALRLPYLFDISDSEDRTFYPYRNGNDFNKFREYRLAETNKTNQGHGETERPKTFLTLPSNVPFIASNFFSRIVHSEKHVPNAFQNGYRSFIGVNYEDYDPDMGEIVRLLTHRDQLFVVFEHGIGIGPINQRIQTGSDSAGAIYVEPSGVLPPNLSFASRKIGSQHGNAIIQTPSAVYGVDVSRRKIWQFRENLGVISDIGFQSYLDKLSTIALTNPRLGYDPNYHEVLFTFGDDPYQWTLCFKEGLERFTSFYSFAGTHYAHRSKDFYSFNGEASQFEIHNAQVRTIYGNVEESYVEFVFNPSPNIAKVVDYLNIISNEISPKQIDLYTYKVDTYKEDVLDESKMFQHAVIEEGTDFFTQENRILLRDRKFVAQVPHVKYINDVDWGLGRLRNKYVIIRITYETDKKVELLSVITDYRMSAS